QRYSGKLLMEAADRAGKAEQAVDAFIALATTANIDEFYLTNPPTASVTAADAATKRAIQQKLAAAKFPRGGAAGEAAAALAGLVATPDEPATPAAPRETTAAPTPPTTPAPPNGAAPAAPPAERRASPAAPPQVGDKH